MNTSENMKAIKAFIDTPDKWTKNACARDENGSAAKDPFCLSSTELRQYKSFCLQGAIMAMVEDESEQLNAIFHVQDTIQFIHEDGYIPITLFNDADETTHETIMALMDAAILRAETQEAEKIS